MKELLIDAELANLGTVLGFVAGELKGADCPLKQQTSIILAVEEIFVNIAQYAYTPEIGGVAIRVSVSKEVTIEFEDEGIPYNPLENEDPDITSGIEEREIGGLGVFMVRQIMDRVIYRHEAGKNVLTISKQIVQEEPAK